MSRTYLQRQNEQIRIATYFKIISRGEFLKTENK